MDPFLKFMVKRSALRNRLKIARLGYLTALADQDRIVFANEVERVEAILKGKAFA